MHAGGRRHFFAGFGQENDVSIKRQVHALQLQKHFQIGGDHRLVVRRSAAVEHAVAFGGREWVNRPVRSIDGNNILVSHDQQRTFFSVALEPRNNAGAARHRFKDFRCDAFALQHALEIVRDFRFIAGRILRVNSYQVSKKMCGFGLCLFGIQRKMPGL